jgi:C4-dicarboxylate-specific signal transduction histidine kinase
MLGDLLALYPAAPWLLIVMTAAATAGLVREYRLRRRLEARSRAILSASFADLAILDRHGIIEACNQNWTRTRAHDTTNPFTAANPGQPWLTDAPAAPADARAELARVREALVAVLGGREPERTLECEWQSAHSRRSSHLRVRAMEGSDGGAVIAHLDVTARKRVEHDARHALHELAHMNMRAGMGELVSTVTHELTQSLTASLGNAQALKRILASGRAAEHDLIPIADDIAAANYEATQVIARIRQMMRKEQYDIQPLDLNAIVLDVVQVLNSSAVNDGVLLVADLDPELPPITADRVQLRQVAMNLVLNAVQATRSHPIDPAVVRIATAAANSHVSIIVDDAGPGVAAEAMPRLFEPYFTTKADGLGMGLSISRSIVESHGGSIGFANVSHGGARFTVTLPVD